MADSPKAGLVGVTGGVDESPLVPESPRRRRVTAAAVLSSRSHRSVSDSAAGMSPSSRPSLAVFRSDAASSMVRRASTAAAQPPPPGATSPHTASPDGGTSAGVPSFAAGATRVTRGRRNSQFKAAVEALMEAKRAEKVAAESNYGQRAGRDLTDSEKRRVAMLRDDWRHRRATVATSSGHRAHPSREMSAEEKARVASLRDGWKARGQAAPSPSRPSHELHPSRDLSEEEKARIRETRSSWAALGPWQRIFHDERPSRSLTAEEKGRISALRAQWQRMSDEERDRAVVEFRTTYQANSRPTSPVGDDAGGGDGDTPVRTASGAGAGSSHEDANPDAVQPQLPHAATSPSSPQSPHRDASRAGRASLLDSAKRANSEHQANMSPLVAAIARSVGSPSSPTAGDGTDAYAPDTKGTGGQGCCHCVVQ